ncbi:MAG: two pore domain potassium channel family protein [Anaerolineae bacterium]|nr:two pore domain potassium channel family protein [Anaerolineae bacterium]
MQIATAPPSSRQAAFERVDHWFNWPIIVLTVAMIPVLVVQETTKDPALLQMADVANWIIWLAFVVEFAVKFALAPQRGTFLRSAWLEILIIVLTPPFLSVPETVEGVRLLRLGRLSRLTRLSRLLPLLRIALLTSLATRFLKRALSPTAFPYVALVVAMVAVVGGAGFFMLEQESGSVHTLGDGLWWAVVTMFTVGYGDIVPRTAAGRIVGVLVMVIGISFISLLTANIAATFFRAQQAQARETMVDKVDELTRKVDELMEMVRKLENSRREDKE